MHLRFVSTRTKQFLLTNLPQAILIAFFSLPPLPVAIDLLAARDHVLVKPDVIFPGQVDQARTIMQL
jgi:hypothetical protein